MVHKHTPYYMQLEENASPTNPPSGHIGIYFKTDGLAYQRDSAGTEFPLGSYQITRDVYGQEADLVATKLTVPRGTLLSVSSGVTRTSLLVNGQKRRLCGQLLIAPTFPITLNFSANIPTLVGASNVYSAQTDSQYFLSTTTAVIGAKAGWEYDANTLACDIRDNPTFETRIRTSTLITTCRIWIGLFAASPNNADTLTSQGIAFRFNATGGWTPCAFDGVTQTTGTTIGTVVLSTAYLLRIRVVGSSAYFSVNDGTEQVVSSNLPTIGRLAPVALIFATAASARGILQGRASIEAD